MPTWTALSIWFWLFRKGWFLIIVSYSRGVVYIPKSADKTDQALASYLNSHEEMEMLKNLFVRESEGVY